MVTSVSDGLLSVEQKEYQELNLSKNLDWLKLRIGKFVSGGIYLIAGQPGIGKSTLGIQLALDLGSTGEKTLYILTEQSKEELSNRARQMSSDWPRELANKALDNIKPGDLYDIETLPNLLGREILNSSGKYYGIKFIVIDSVHGHGLSAGATNKYKRLYEFCSQCKSNGITVLLVAHVTKKGDIAGPKDMEHNVDCVIVMRKAMIYRPLFIPKNRYGPAIFKPIPLEMDKITTALKVSTHSETVSSIANTFLGNGLAEAQAAVSLPSYGTRGKITAPNLPRKEIEQLTNCISQIPDMEIEDLDYTIHCRLPGEKRYKALLGLPVCMALISSYIQRDIPAYHIYLGEIDLLRKVRKVPDEIITTLWEQIENGSIDTPKRIFLPKESAEIITNEIDGITVISCEKLDDAVFFTWPELKK
ncbi:MAG: hypothetical protein A2X61_16425 [Ignavibacteria bacterium GWB2_35_12]|nr:MAG: hypothetical protein A2X61_16425 [Ignavibacteria bacterium GWB2_35_12]OGU94047.1 MAG: hypothetical protein A2220_07625 [Ignavibacteria bacterium RIFOXYA2_FULL_35_10]OGV23591.1 MAG: hypothetical protein A2475_07740 [Ignavibacteria bacterium RIFOXYC2_FULL_35_21]